MLLRKMKTIACILTLALVCLAAVVHDENYAILGNRYDSIDAMLRDERLINWFERGTEIRIFMGNGRRYCAVISPQDEPLYHVAVYEISQVGALVRACPERMINGGQHLIVGSNAKTGLYAVPVSLEFGNIVNLNEPKPEKRDTPISSKPPRQP